MSYYEHHVFFCCNQRSRDKASCGGRGASEAEVYAKDRIAELNRKGPGGIRVNKAGCLGRCDEGPVLVVYPQGVWYRCGGIADVEEIIREHLLGGRVVERLKIPS